MLTNQKKSKKKKKESLEIMESQQLPETIMPSN